MIVRTISMHSGVLFSAIAYSNYNKVYVLCDNADNLLIRFPCSDNIELEGNH